MAAIPTEVIFVLIFIAFSVLEGVGRKRKTQPKGAPGQSPGPRPRPEQRPSREPEEASARGSSPRSVGPADEAGQEGSEGLIPKEIWEEILGLARGTPPEPRRAAPPPDLPEASPRREDETLEEIPPFEARTLEPVDFDDERRVVRPERLPVALGGGPAKGLAARKGTPLQRSGAKAVAAAKVRVPSPPVPPGKPSTGQGIRADLLGEGSQEDLRKAIILTEVLGLPVGLRD